MKRRFGHGAWKLEVTGWLGYVAGRLVVDDWWVIYAGFLALAAVGGIARGVHGAGPCDVCRAKVPPNGAWQAQELRPALRTYHRLIGWSGFLIVLPASLASAFLPAPCPLAGAVLLGAYMAATVALGELHRPVQSWCPRCSDGSGGGGGHDDLLDDPGPAKPAVR